MTHSKWKISSSAARRLKIENNNTPSLDLFRRYHSSLLKKYQERELYIEKNGLAQSDLDVKLLAKIQHHGGATGLVDFTKNAVVALWFACELFQNEDGMVYVLDLTDHVDEIAKLSLEECKMSIGDLLAFKDRRPSPLKTPRASFPNEGTSLASLYYWLPAMALDNRVFSQHSCFLFGLPILNNDKHFRFIELNIKYESKNKIREQIKKLLDIDHSRMFSDFDGYSTYCHHLSLGINGFFEDNSSYSKAIEFYQNKDFDNAIIGFTTVIDSINANDKDSIEDNEAILSRLYRGMCYREKYNIKDISKEIKDSFSLKAIEDFEYIISLDKSSPRVKAESFGNMGAIYINELKDINKAICKLTMITTIADVPRNLMEINHFYLGRANQEYGDTKSAIDEYTLAIENKDYLSDEQLAKAYISRGECYAVDNQYKEALTESSLAKEVKNISDELKKYINTCCSKWEEDMTKCPSINLTDNH